MSIEEATVPIKTVRRRQLKFHSETCLFFCDMVNSVKHFRLTPYNNLDINKKYV